MGIERDKRLAGLFARLGEERAANNNPWVTLIRLAFEHDAEAAAKAAEEIIDRDRQIDEVLWAIVREYRGE